MRTVRVDPSATGPAPVDVRVWRVGEIKKGIRLILLKGGWEEKR
jgi:hypothetical protein